MEVTIHSVAITFALVGLVSYVFNWVWLRPKKFEMLLRQQGLRGNPYRLYYGDAKDMFKLSKEVKNKPLTVSDDILPHILPFHHHIINKYGKNSFTWSGSLPRVNIMDPELINEILLKSNVFRKPKQSPLHNLLVAGLVTYEDEKWAKHRRIMNPAFHLEKLKVMASAMYISCSEMISKWEALISEKNSCELDVSPYLYNLTSDVISRTAFGSSYEQGRRIFELQKEQCHLLDQALQSQIPGLRFLPTKTNSRMKEIRDEVQALVRDMINERDREMKLGEDCKDNLLGTLLKANMKEIKEHRQNDTEDNVGINIDEVIEECKLFYFAGQETTANLLIWTMVLLSQHPNWQMLAREEVFQVFGSKKPDNHDGLNRLKLVTMILNESLRLYPPSIMLMRVVTEETKLKEMILPAGIRIIVPTIFVHHDFEIWGKDAKEFKPERFSQGIAKATKKQVSFLPFGGGPRICIGSNFAMMEAKMALAMILRHFSFELSPSYSHAPSFIVTLRPKHGVQMILHRVAV